MRRYRYLLLLFLFLPQFLYAQGLPFYNPGGAVISGAGRPIAGATITVCIGSTVPPLGTLCTATLSKASLYSNYALTLPIANPQATDGYGNIGPFYAAQGMYVITTSGPAVATTSFPYGNAISNATGVALLPGPITFVSAATVPRNVTFPDASFTIAGLGLANAFTGNNTMRQLNDTVYLVPGDAIYSCNDVGMNAAIVAAEALGGLNGGQVDATGCPGTNTIAATVNVGSSTKKVSVKLGEAQTWNCSINNAAQDCWAIFDYSNIFSTGSGVNMSQLGLTAAASVRSIVRFSGATGATLARLDNIEVENTNAGTIANALVDMPQGYNVTSHNLAITNCYAKCLWIHDTSALLAPNAVTFYDLDINGGFTAGAVPLQIDMNFQSFLSAVSFIGGNIGHPGTGLNTIVINGHGNTDLQSLNFANGYIETSNKVADAGITPISATDVVGLNFEGYNVNYLMAGGGTSACVTIAESGASKTDNITFKNFQCGTTTGALIANSVPGAPTGNVPTGTAIGLYAFHSSEKTLTHSYVGNAHFSYNGFSLFGPPFNAASPSPTHPVHIWEPGNTATGIAIEQNANGKWRLGMAANQSVFCLGQNDAMTVCPLAVNPTAPNNSLNINGSGQIVSPVLLTPTLTGAANGTGLQLFSTSTTCSTSGVIDNTCTTASITLPVAYADTNYRLFCTGISPTNVPVIVTVTKSNTTFTITIASLTAAVATFSSFDCVAGHN